MHLALTKHLDKMRIDNNILYLDNSFIIRVVQPLDNN